MEEEACYDDESSETKSGSRRCCWHDDAVNPRMFVSLITTLLPRHSRAAKPVLPAFDQTDATTPFRLTKGCTWPAHDPTTAVNWRHCTPLGENLRLLDGPEPCPLAAAAAPITVARIKSRYFGTDDEGTCLTLGRFAPPARPERDRGTLRR
jgi:hypothetical protein